MSLPSIPPNDPLPRAEPLRLPRRQPPPAAAERSSALGARRDRLEVSDAARALLEATQAASAAGADRAELILRIRQQIAEGHYEADAEAVARALIERLEG